MTHHDAVLDAACAMVGMPSHGATLIRSGENDLYRLPNRIVARITRPGQLETAHKEVRVSQWLSALGIPVVQAVADLQQPVDIDGRAVTFWHELPAHHEGSVEQIAELLHRIHQAPAAIELPNLAPFVRLGQRIDDSTILPPSDREWLRQHLRRLEQIHERMAQPAPPCVIHGDAWGGNFVTTASGPVVLDFERFSLGPPEWDLTSIAVEYVTFGSLPRNEWRNFCKSYGTDVTGWANFDLYRDIRELRRVTFSIQVAERRPEVRLQAEYRIKCIQGLMGPRPWRWKAVP